MGPGLSKNAFDSIDCTLLRVVCLTAHSLFCSHKAFRPRNRAAIKTFSQIKKDADELTRLEELQKKEEEDKTNKEQGLPPVAETRVSSLLADDDAKKAARKSSSGKKRSRRRLALHALRS